MTRRSLKKWKDRPFEVAWTDPSCSIIKLRAVLKDRFGLTWSGFLVMIKASWIWLSFMTIGWGNIEHGVKSNVKNHGTDVIKRERG